MGVGSPSVSLRLVLIVIMALATAQAATWCVARSGASVPALQSGIDYACGVGAADCVPIQSSGLCYLPNSLQSHASYAFNSYFQRSGQAPGSCDFSGTATTTISDPSYGSCTYPSSSGSAGGGTATPPPNTPNAPVTPSPPLTPSPPFTPNTPNTPVTPSPPLTLSPPLTPGSGGGLSPGSGGFTPGFSPSYDPSKAPPSLPFFLLSCFLYHLLLLF